MFQFPTGWNSTSAWLPLPSSTLSFNSQRDGILPAELLKLPWFQGFQFPTGWNSTVTGWGSGSITAGFNSQRDGILRKSTKFYHKIYWGSFNSQRDGILHLFQDIWLISQDCFNSQRDGILLYKILSQNLLRKFQFPTGWNSTDFLAASFIPILSVSIPNGMEFYKLLTLESLPLW